MHRSVLAALVATLLAAPHAQAADITPDQAKALEGQVRSWAQGLLGPDARLADRPVQVTPEGDHYRLAIPFKVTRSLTPGEIVLTGTARPASGGRWTIEDVRIPSPSSFTAQMRIPPKPGQATPEPPIPVDYTVTIGNQENQGVYDPSFATPSTFTTSLQELKVVATSALTDQITTAKRVSGVNILRPSGTDRADLTVDSTVEGYALSSKIGDNQKVDFTADKARVTGELTAVSRDRIAQIIPALVRLTGGVAPGLPKPGAASASAPSVDPQLVRILVQSLQDFASELALDETIDGISVHRGASGGTASQLRIGLGAKSDNGLMQAHMDLGLDGLALPDMQLGEMADLLPRKIALRPVLSGVPTQPLIQLLANRANPNDAGPPPEFAALFARGGVSAGLESFAFDMGGTSFAGMGAVLIDSPQQMTGQAQVTATNFDKLMQRANTTPQLASVLLPALVFAKGIGRAVGDQMVWDITYRDNKLLVNGTDLSAMTGGGRR